MQPRNRKPITPGEMLREGFLDEMGITQFAFAKHIGVSLTTISQLINGHKRVTPFLANKIGAALGTSPEFWLNAQMAMDLWELKQLNEPLPKCVIKKGTNTLINELARKKTK